MADYDDLYLEVVSTGLKILSFRFDLDDDEQDKRDEWKRMLIKFTQTKKRKEYIETFAPVMTIMEATHATNRKKYLPVSKTSSLN